MEIRRLGDPDLRLPASGPGSHVGIQPPVVSIWRALMCSEGVPQPRFSGVELRGNGQLRGFGDRVDDFGHLLGTDPRSLDRLE